jgi:DNA-binding transcriptional MerR regulator
LTAKAHYFFSSDIDEEDRKWRKFMDDTTLLPINAFSAFTGVRQSTLRYYDEIGLLPATHRGENNYRYYAPFQIINLNFIKVLIDLGVPLAAIKELSKNRTPDKMLNLLSQQEFQLDVKLQQLHTAYSILHTLRKNIQAGLAARHLDQISIEPLEATCLIMGDRTDFGEKRSFYKPFKDFCFSAKEKRINLSYPVGGYHEDFHSFLVEPGQPDRFFSLDPRGNQKRRAGHYLSAYFQGYYGQFGDLPQNLQSYAQQHQLVFVGPVYTVYLLDEISMTDPEQYLTQILVEIEKN